MKTFSIVFFVTMLIFFQDGVEAGVVKVDANGIGWEMKKGDSLWKICKVLCAKTNLSVTNGIAEENGIKNVRRILKGKVILIAGKYIGNFNVVIPAESKNEEVVSVGAGRVNQSLLDENSALLTEGSRLKSGLLAAQDEVVGIKEDLRKRNFALAALGILFIIFVALATVGMIFFRKEARNRPDIGLRFRFDELKGPSDLYRFGSEVITKEEFVKKLRAAWLEHFRQGQDKQVGERQSDSIQRFWDETILITS